MTSVTIRQHYDVYDPMGRIPKDHWRDIALMKAHHVKQVIRTNLHNAFDILNDLEQHEAWKAVEMSRDFFLRNTCGDAPTDVRQRAEQIASKWQGWITWHPDRTMGDCGGLNAASGPQPAPMAADMPPPPPTPTERHTPLSSLTPKKPGRRGSAGTTEVGYVNRNGQKVVRSTGKAGTDHGQYIYVLRCGTCGHEYGANGSDIFLRRCPNHDRGAPGLAF